MLHLKIPGSDTMTLEHLLLDYNGTLAVDGTLIEGVMERLEADRFAPTRLLDAMTQAIVPKRMWFTKFESKEKDVKIAGIALDNKTVADFMVRLEQSGLFSDVDLKTLKQKKVSKSNLKSFQVSCTKKQPNLTKTN